uniref:Uncharacterized protein n=1 Tax=Oryza barthii TaxID=65489 RepID=A0A0D3EV96_9ORYZ
MPETRANADDVELPAAGPAMAPPPHVVVRIPDVDGKSDGRRLTAVEKPPYVSFLYTPHREGESFPT